MTYDLFTRVSNNQSIGAGAVSEKSIPLATALGPGGVGVARNIGDGVDLKFRVHVTQAFNTGVASCAFTIVLATDEALTIGEYFNTVTLPTTKLTKGVEFDIDIPSITPAMSANPGNAYIGLLYLPSADLGVDGGRVSAFIPLRHSPSLVRRYAANYTGPA